MANLLGTGFLLTPKNVYSTTLQSALSATDRTFITGVTGKHIIVWQLYASPLANADIRFFSTSGDLLISYVDAYSITNFTFYPLYLPVPKGESLEFDGTVATTIALYALYSLVNEINLS